MHAYLFLNTKFRRYLSRGKDFIILQENYQKASDIETISVRVAFNHPMKRKNGLEQ